MEQRDLQPRTAVLDRQGPGGGPGPGPNRPSKVPNNEELRRGQGVRDLVGGSVLIGIGFLFGGSVFMGNPTLLDWIFDGLGIFWIAKGIYFIATAKPSV